MSEKIVQFNEEIIKGQIRELVRGSVEETLNELLEVEAEKLTQAARYERNEARQGYRSGHYDRNLTTISGDVTLQVPRLKGVSFETAIIERYRRRESSVEEALIEMYLAGVSVRRVEDITEALWGSKVSPATISELNKKAYIHIEDWRNHPLQGGKYPYVYVDGIYLRRNWGGEYENVAILVAIAVNEDGYREVLGAAQGMKEDKASWVSFFQWLRGRGLDGVKLVVGDKCILDLARAVPEIDLIHGKKEGGHDVLPLGVEVVRDCNIVDAVLWKELLGVVAGLPHITAQSGQILGDDCVGLALLELLQHLLKCRAVEVAAGVAVIHKFPHQSDAVLLAVVLYDHALVGNTGRFAALSLFIGETQVGKSQR